MLNIILEGPGERWLLTLHEIGESRDEARQLAKEHVQLKQRAQVSFSEILFFFTNPSKLGHSQRNENERQWSLVTAIQSIMRKVFFIFSEELIHVFQFHPYLSFRVKN